MADAQDFVNNPTPESTAPPPGGFNEVPQQAPATFSLRDAGHAQQFFNDPELMFKAGQLALSLGLPEGVKWLERGHQAARENVFEAMGHAQRGDMNAAVKAFNKSGTFTKATSMRQNQDGTYTVEQADADPVTFNMDQLQKSFLSPKDYFAQQQHQDTIGVQKEHNRILEKQTDAQAGVNAAHAKYYEGAAKFQDERAGMMENLANTRAQAAQAIAEARAQGGKALSELNAKYGPNAAWQTTYDKALEASGGDVTKARDAADYKMVGNPFNTIKRGPNGEIVVLDSFDTTHKLRQFPNAAAYEAYTGQKLPAEGPGSTATPPAKERNPGAIRRLLPAAAPYDSEAAKAVAADPTKAQAPAFRSLQSNAGAYGKSAAQDPDLIALQQRAAGERRAGHAAAANNLDAQFSKLRMERYGL